MAVLAERGRLRLSEHDGTVWLNVDEAIGPMGIPLDVDELGWLAKVGAAQAWLQVADFPTGAQAADRGSCARTGDDDDLIPVPAPAVPDGPCASCGSAAGFAHMPGCGYEPVVEKPRDEVLWGGTYDPVTQRMTGEPEPEPVSLLDEDPTAAPETQLAILSMPSLLDQPEER